MLLKYKCSKTLAHRGETELDRAKSAIVAIHLLSVISSTRLYVGPLEGALNVLALRYHQVAWSSVCIYGLLRVSTDCCS